MSADMDKTNSPHLSGGLLETWHLLRVMTPAHIARPARFGTPTELLLAHEPC